MTKKTETQKLNEKIIWYEGEISKLDEIIKSKDQRIDDREDTISNLRSKNTRISKELSAERDARFVSESLANTLERKLERSLGYIDHVNEDKVADEALYLDQQQPPMRVPRGPKIHDIHNESLSGRIGRVGGSFDDGFKSRGY